MKAILRIAAVAALLAATPALYAGEGCGAKAEGGCGSKAAACSKSDEGNLAKGGAAEKGSKAELGQKAPGFTLKDTKGTEHSLSGFAGKPVVLVFYNQECPFVKEVAPRLDEFAKTYSDKGVVTVAIDAGDNNEASDIAKYAESRTFPILVNQESNVALDYGAKVTPEVFVLDKEGTIVYHGAFDNGKEGAAEGSRKSYAEDAVKAVLEGKEVAVKQAKAFGCTVKLNKKTVAARTEKAEKHAHHEGDGHDHSKDAKKEEKKAMN